MALLAENLRSLGRPVVDKTGITDRIAFTLDWVPEPRGPAPTDAANPPDLQGPTILEALREQLGLKLESTRAPIQVLVVDHVEGPSGN
jgi:uncharacterized protein (TIGR03435 family)